MEANTNKFNREVENYVDNEVAAFATKINNVESIKCVRKVNDIYMELIHEDSAVRYFDITGLDTSGIGIMIGHIIANQPVQREIKDREAKKEIRRMFK